MGTAKILNTTTPDLHHVATPAYSWPRLNSNKELSIYEGIRTTILQPALAWLPSGCRFQKPYPAEWRLLTNRNIIAVDDRNCHFFRPHAVRLVQVAIAA
jgi:hypothetical protein